MPDVKHPAAADPWARRNNRMHGRRVWNLSRAETRPAPGTAPWEMLRINYPRVILMRAAIPERGRFYAARNAIVVRTGLLLCEERSVLWHELVHLKHDEIVRHAQSSTRSDRKHSASEKQPSGPFQSTSSERPCTAHGTSKRWPTT